MFMHKKILIRIENDRVIRLVSDLEPKPLDGDFWQLKDKNGDPATDLASAEEVIATLDSGTSLIIHDMRGGFARILASHPESDGRQSETKRADLFVDNRISPEDDEYITDGYNGA